MRIQIRVHNPSSFPSSRSPLRTNSRRSLPTTVCQTSSESSKVTRRLGVSKELFPGGLGHRWVPNTRVQWAPSNHSGSFKVHEHEGGFLGGPQGSWHQGAGTLRSAGGQLLSSSDPSSSPPRPLVAAGKESHLL